MIEYRADLGDGVVCDPPEWDVQWARRRGLRIWMFVELANGGYHIRTEPLEETIGEQLELGR